MKINLISLSKMVLNLALNISDHKHEVIAYEISEKAFEIAVNSRIKCT